MPEAGAAAESGVVPYVPLGEEKFLDFTTPFDHRRRPELATVDTVSSATALLGTGAAMIGQGGLAALLVWSWFYKDSEFGAGIGAGVEGISTFLGKVFLLYALNKGMFVSAGRGLYALATEPGKTLSALCPDLSKRPHSFAELATMMGSGLYKVGSTVGTLNGAHMFFYLSVVGMEGAAAILEDFSPEAAAVVRSDGVVYPLAATAALTNLGSFPGIHDAGFAIYQGQLRRLFSSDATLRAQMYQESLLNKALNQVWSDFKSLRTDEDGVCAEALARINQLLGRVNSDLAAEEGLEGWALLEWHLQALDKKLLAGDAVDFSGTLVEWCKEDLDPDFTEEHFTPFAERLAGLGSLAVPAVCAYGLSNFREVGEAAVAVWSSNSALQFVAGIFGVGSMSLMSSFTAEYGDWLAKRALGCCSRARLPEPREDMGLTSHHSRLAIKASILLMCVLGGGPNVYQSLFIAGQSPAAASAAGLSSFLLEYWGSLGVALGLEEKRLLKHALAATTGSEDRQRAALSLLTLIEAKLKDLRPPAPKKAALGGALLTGGGSPAPVGESAGSAASAGSSRRQAGGFCAWLCGSSAEAGSEPDSP